jgi:hypothetical protein
MNELSNYAILDSFDLYLLGVFGLAVAGSLAPLTVEKVKKLRSFGAFTISHRKVGGIRFIKVGRINASFSVSRH